MTYFASNGSATSGTDYTTALGTLSWPNGDTANKTFVVSILDDASIEPDETFSVSLSSPTGGATLGSPSLATVTIADNDTPLPSVPTNLRTSPVTISFGGNFSVLWNASTGSVNHYTLHETRTIGANPPTTATYTTVPPTTSIQFSKGGAEKEFDYMVKACATGTETQCSAWSPPVNIMVCPMNPCP